MTMSLFGAADVLVLVPLSVADEGWEGLGQRLGKDLAAVADSHCRPCLPADAV